MSRKRNSEADDAATAGAVKPKTPLQKLRKAWRKADPAERIAFLEWLAASDAFPPPASTASENIPISTGRYLRPSAAMRIKEIMARRGLSAGDVMGELGFSPLDPSLRRALTRNYGLRLMVIEALETWLAANADV